MSGISTRPWWLGLAVMTLGGIWLSGAFRLDVVASYGGIGPNALETVFGLPVQPEWRPLIERAARPDWGSVEGTCKK
jgi:hypothetical protein